MSKLFDRRARLTQEQMRGARPMRNQLARWEALEDGSLVVEVPLAAKSGWMARSLAKRGKIPDVRKYELEPVGAFVFELCDGKHKCETISRKLKDRYKMNRMEADAALVAFLQTLSQRGLISLIVQDRN